MGSGASSPSDTSNSGQTASPRRVANKTGGNNFQEVQVQPAKDHSTQDFRNSPAKRQAADKAKSQNQTQTKQPDKNTTKSNDNMKASSSEAKSLSVSRKETSTPQKTSPVGRGSKVNKTGQRSNQEIPLVSK